MQWSLDAYAERVLDQALVPDREVGREAVERGRGARPTSSALERTRRACAIASTTVRERHGAVVLDIHRHLGDAAVLEPQADRAEARQALGAALANARGDPLARPPRVAGGASSTLNATSGGRAPTSTAPAVGCSCGGPKSGFSSPVSIRCRERGRAAAAQLGAGAAVGEHPVQKDGQLELLAEPVGEHERLGARGAAIGVVEEHDRCDVERADARVDAVVGAMSIVAVAMCAAASTRRRELAGRARDA